MKINHNLKNLEWSLIGLTPYAWMFSLENAGFSPEVNVDRIIDTTDGFSGADLAAIANTAVSLVVQEYISKYPSPAEAKKHAEEAIITQKHVEEAIGKVRATKEGKIPEKEIKPYYR